jgi:hypothetical protein
VSNFSNLSVEYEIGESFLIANTLHSGKLIFRAHSHLSNSVSIFLHIRDDVLNSLLHKYAVVSLSSHTRVSTLNTMRDLSKREERTSTTSFSAYGRSVLHIPSYQNFTGTESSNRLVFSSFRFLKVIFSSVVSKVEYHKSGKKREDSILLELEAHDRSVRLSIRSNSHSLLRVSNCVMHDSFSSS